MARHAKKAARGRSPTAVAPEEVVTALVERLHALPADADASTVQAALGDDRAAVPAAALTLVQTGDDAGQLALQALLQTPEVALLAIPALATMQSAAVARLLERVASEATDRVVAKAARRALHTLASRGLAVELPPSAGAAPVYRPAPAEGVAWERAIAGSIDGQGQRSLLLAQARLPVGGNLAIAVLDEGQGLLLFEAIRQTHRQLEKEWEAYLEQRDDTHAQEIPFGYAQWLLSEAAGLAPATGTALPEDYTAWREITGAAPPDTTPRLIYDEVGVDPSERPGGALTQSAELLDEPEVESWHLPLDALSAFTGELLSARTSPITLSEAAQLDRERQIWARAANEQFTAELRQRYKRRLEETALLFQRSERSLQAQAALAAAMALGDETFIPSEVPLLMAMVQRDILAGSEIAAPTTEEGREARTLLYGAGHGAPAEDQ